MPQSPSRIASSGASRLVPAKDDGVADTDIRTYEPHINLVVIN